MSLSHKVFALIGPSGVGKTTLGQLASEKIEIEFLDIDELFRNKFGPIGKYGKKHGWKKYFHMQSKLINETAMKSVNSSFPSIIAFPAGAFYHPDYLEISKRNYSNLKDLLHFICVLADQDDNLGSSIAQTRQESRSYKFDRIKKRNEYLAQSKFYKNISELIIYNENGCQDVALSKLLKYLKNYL